MKNIFEILSANGIEVPEDKKDAVTKSVAENYKTIAEHERVKNRIEVERDNYKDSLETAQNALKEFEGVDVKDLQGKVSQLTQSLADKENEFNEKIAEMEFNLVIENAINASGAKNAKAVKALLDIEALKDSKNQVEDIKNALEAVKAENDYMFGSNEPINNVIVRNTGDNQNSGVSKEAFAKMGYTERLELKRTNPEKYNELKG